MIEVLADSWSAGGRGARRIVVSMTHATHRFLARRLTGDPVPRLLTGGSHHTDLQNDEQYLTVAAL